MAPTIHPTPSKENIMTHRGYAITSPTDCDPADLAICSDCLAYFDGGNGGDCPHCDTPGGSMWAHPEDAQTVAHHNTKE